MEIRRKERNYRPEKKKGASEAPGDVKEVELRLQVSSAASSSSVWIFYDAPA